jgi:hypothetical protein
MVDLFILQNIWKNVNIFASLKKTNANVMVLSHFDLCKLIIIELCYLLILKINYIGMIRQKRFSISRIPQNNQNGNKEALHQGNTNDMIDK